ncbi:MAG TPA: DUF1697 domain-containing protein [Myxococcota bacterium]|nr:DUF1697 domain-containing protein [Myxococcota bacterium]
MPRYAAFLRGVSPMNAKMPELVRAFERAGFTKVKTLLSSGNVVFDAAAKTEASVERKAEAAMAEHLGKTFYTIVRPVHALQAMLECDPFAAFRLPPGAKRVVTFMRAPPPPVALPAILEDAQIVAIDGREAFTIYVPSGHGPVFMRLIEKTLGADVTTRTWDTVGKVARA